MILRLEQLVEYQCNDFKINAGNMNLYKTYSFNNQAITAGNFKHFAKLKAF